MSRATYAQINLLALVQNLNLARSTSQAKQMAIIKANAYGHGILPIARALQQADAFGVATIEEAITLREGGIANRIVLLEGFQRKADLLLIHAYQLEAVVHHQHQVAMLEKADHKPLTVWLKLDTGMHRLGFSREGFHAAYERLMQCPKVNKPIHLMTHLACADEPDSNKTQEQIRLFNEACTHIQEGERSLANSAGILAWPQSHADWVRPGIMLYGVSPFEGKTGQENQLQPVMTLYSEIISIHHYEKGDTIGYGATYQCEKNMTVAAVAIGYGDGYPRHAPSGTPVLVNGQHCKLVGRVSMDMITIDVTACAEVNIGDPVVLWGEGLPVENIAQHAGTIGYELLCRVTPRVELRYSGDSIPS